MNGVLLIDKPAGAGSAEVVRRIKRLVKPAKVGHLGTLDPFATGLLPILIGEATKIAQFLEHHAKRYEGVIALGAQTDTLDPAGQIVETAAVPSFDQPLLDGIARRFTGQFEQVAPVYSAIKRGGVPLYKLARKGMDPAPPARTVRIDYLRLSAAGPDRLAFCVRCATGTYIRALARDIAAELGTAGHLAQLRRLETGGFSIEGAIGLDDAIAIFQSGGVPPLIGLEPALADMPAIQVDPAAARRVRNGDASALLSMVRIGQGRYKVVCDGKLVAIAQFEPNGRLGLARVFGE
jgi:tRNA pseudouridine55 synthase